MKITINFERIKTLKLTPNQYFFLACKVGNFEPWFELSAEEFDTLQDEGYIKNTEEGVVVRMKATRLINDSGVIPDTDIEKLVDQYRALFPVGVKTGGYPVKGDRQNCLKKMKTFLANHDFTPNEIIDATRAYLAIQKRQNWKATQLAHYYIEKDGISNLSSMCEDIRDNGLKLEKGSIGNVEEV